MSINVDKMDTKHSSDSLHKSKPVMKRRKKTSSSASDLSSDSLSPKKHKVNGLPDDYRSSPETVFNSPFHSISTDKLNGSTDTTNGHRFNDNEDSKSSDHHHYHHPRNNHHNHQQHKHHHHSTDSDGPSSVNKSQRQPRTPEDFYLFCQFILEYANYNEMCDQEELRSSNHSPLDSTGSAAESIISSSAVNDESNHGISNAADDDDAHKELSSKDLNDSSTTLNETGFEDVTKASAIDASSTNEDDDSDIDAESYNLITCYCGKPYAARPMIECSRCLTWLHLSCAKIKRKKIPDIFICVKCVKKSVGQSKPPEIENDTVVTVPSSAAMHPKDHHQSNNEPKENNRSKKSIGLNNLRSDKLETSILQPLNVSAAAYETGANKLENIKTTPAVSGIAVKYK